MTSTRPLWRIVITIAICVLMTGLTLTAQNKSDKVASKTSGKSAIGKEIAITFDELPAARTFEDVDREAITYLLLNGLKLHGVKATGFVVGDQIQGSFDVLGKWLNDGHQLGNLTYSGQDYNSIGPEQFIRDIKMGDEALEPMLKGFGQKKRYFRYPYLHYGDIVERRRAARLYLEDKGYIVCPATVIPEDYLYNLTLGQLGKTPDSSKYERLMNDYVNHVLDELARQAVLADQMLGRRIRHILLLRANRLNAVFLNDLLTALEAEGYSFITLDKALQDKVYQKPESYYGLKGISYLEMILQSDPDLLPAR